jgi:hypothetical protein
MPFFMAISHWKWLKTREPAYFDVTKAWFKPTPLKAIARISNRTAGEKSDLITAAIFRSCDVPP